jgi:hypothetical protein
MKEKQILRAFGSIVFVMALPPLFSVRLFARILAVQQQFWIHLKLIGWIREDFHMFHTISKKAISYEKEGEL